MGKELPKNWEVSIISDIGEVLSGSGFPKKYQGNSEGKFPFFKVGDISNNVKNSIVYIENSENRIDKSVKRQIKAKILPKGSIVFAKIGEALRLNRRVILNQPSIIDNNAIGIKSFDDFYNYKLLFYYLKTLDLSAYSAGNAVPSVRKSTIESIQIPLPPLPEQHRIVTKLDQLFGQLELIKQSLDNIPQLLKDFRQQVLTQAVTGKLTEEWRKGKSLSDWKIELAKNCCEKVQSGGTPRGSNFALSGIPFFKVYNIVDQQISFDYKPQYVTEEIQNTQCKKSICYPNDVLMNIVGPPLNKVAIVPERFTECNINQAITLFRPKSYLNNKFLYYFLREGTPVNSLVNETRGVVGQVNISLTQCREFNIPIPPEKEQQEIVNRVESLFAKADTIETHYEALKQKIDNLPQTILHKAFKGELVPQLASDGDAKELLDAIKKLKKK